MALFKASDLENNKSNMSMIHLTANIFESGPMPTPWKFLDSPPVIPSC